MKLSARRGLECRILQHLSQTPGRKAQPSASICLLLFNFLLLLQNLLTSLPTRMFSYIVTQSFWIGVCFVLLSVIFRYIMRIDKKRYGCLWTWKNLKSLQYFCLKSPAVKRSRPLQFACYFSISPATSKSIDIPANPYVFLHCDIGYTVFVLDLRPFFTTFDYIVAVIQALQFVDYKDVLRLYSFNAI
jgi:hypothetical protein